MKANDLDIPTTVIPLHHLAKLQLNSGDEVHFCLIAIRKSLDSNQFKLLEIYLNRTMSNSILKLNFFNFLVLVIIVSGDFVILRQRILTEFINS